MKHIQALRSIVPQTTNADHWSAADMQSTRTWSRKTTAANQMKNLTKFIGDVCEKSDCTDAVFTDLSRAYDTVIERKLCIKLLALTHNSKLMTISMIFHGIQVFCGTERPNKQKARINGEKRRANPNEECPVLLDILKISQFCRRKEVISYKQMTVLCSARKKTYLTCNRLS